MDYAHCRSCDKVVDLDSGYFTVYNDNTYCGSCAAKDVYTKSIDLTEEELIILKNAIEEYEENHWQNNTFLEGDRILNLKGRLEQL